VEAVDLVLKFLGVVVASSGVVVAAIGGAHALRQYRENQRWKETEFIAKLYKDFLDDACCQRAMSMLDWSNRDLNFGSEERKDMKPHSWPALARALRKPDATPFTDLEVAIRDTFDRFLQYFEQFERAMRNDLIRQNQVYPYFSYWINMLHGKRHLSNDVQKRVLEYIVEYGFDDAKRFLDRRWPS